MPFIPYMKKVFVTLQSISYRLTTVVPNTLL